MVARYYLKLIQIISVLCAREAHTKVKDSATNLKMDETGSMSCEVSAKERYDTQRNGT